MSATPDSTFTNPNQLIADLQRQLAERDAALAEALEQQTATAEVLQVINASPGDLAPVFEVIVEKAMHLCDAAFGYMVGRKDGEAGHTLATRGIPADYAEFRRRNPVRAGQAGTAARIRAGEPFVHTLDLKDDDLYRGGDPQRCAMVDLGGARTSLIVALKRGPDSVGTINLYRQEVRPFSDKQIALLQNFAAQAVIAMENARLITETREALEQRTATAEVLGVINASPGDLKPVFEAILDKALRLCDAGFGHFRTYDGERFPLVAARGDPRFIDALHQHATLVPGPDHPLLARIIAGENINHIVDAADSDSYRRDAHFRELVDTGFCRSLLGVALRKDKTLLGYVVVYRQELRPFTDKQIALLQNFAAQAVIAMENARLITETREALEQQTATAEVLGIINSSPGDLAPVFDAMLKKMMRLCEAAHGHFLVYDGTHFDAGAFRGEETFGAVWREGLPFAPAHNGNPLARLISGEWLVHDADAREGDAYREAPPYRRIIDAGEIRSSLTVGLRKEDKLLGAVRLYRREVRPFSDKQIMLVENFAAQAVIAMENARLITETREALEQQTATAEVLQVINASPGDLAPVFDAMLGRATRLCDAAVGTFWSYDGNGFRVLAATLGDIGQTAYPGPGTPLWRIASGENVVQIADVQAEQRYQADADHSTRTRLSGTRTALAVALRKDETLIGAITAGRQEIHPFTDKQIELVRTFADQAVIAMENARLLDELRQRTDEVAELNRGLEARVADQVEELGRVGRLKRFLAPQLAELIVSQGNENILESHRREIVVVFCDLRGYTAFTETAEPEEVLEFLRQYHGALGPLVSQFEGTLDQFSGDGIMVFFNDPMPCPDPAERAVKMAMAMRDTASELIAAWRIHGSELGFGAGIAQGYATLGQIGFSDRSGYTAIGTVCNLASRLCAEAKDGQILVSSRIAEAVRVVVRLEDLGNLELRGLRRPVAAFNVVPSISAVDSRPHLTVIAREPGV